MGTVKTRTKTFSTKVNGTWINADLMGHYVTGHWHWHEAKEKLLSELDEWKSTIGISNIISANFHKHTGTDMVTGASLELEIIYEEDI